MRTTQKTWLFDETTVMCVVNLFWFFWQSLHKLRLFWMILLWGVFCFFCCRYVYDFAEITTRCVVIFFFIHMCVSERKSARVLVCACERERERDKVCRVSCARATIVAGTATVVTGTATVAAASVCVCVCVYACACARARARACCVLRAIFCVSVVQDK